MVAAKQIRFSRNRRDAHLFRACRALYGIHPFHVELGFLLMEGMFLTAANAAARSSGLRT